MCDLCGLEQFEAAVVLSFHYYILRVLPTLIVACIMVCTVMASIKLYTMMQHSHLIDDVGFHATFLTLNLCDTAYH